MYTKGKWIVSDKYPGVLTVESESHGICTMQIGGYEQEKLTNANLISAAPEMFEALKRVEAYLVANEDVLAPFPTRSELDNIRAAMFKTGLYQYCY